MVTLAQGCRSHTAAELAGTLGKDAAGGEVQNVLPGGWAQSQVLITMAWERRASAPSEEVWGPGRGGGRRNGEGERD